MKFGLGLHTTTGELGVCLNNFQGDVRFNSWNLGRDLANNLHECLASFLNPLSWQDLEFIGVAKGPGSYTSTRIGIVTAKTLAQQLNIPVYGISSLASVAWAQHKKNNNCDHQSFLVEMKANQEKVYGSIYQIKTDSQHLLTIMADQLFSLLEWQEKLNYYRNQFSHSSQHLIASDQLAYTTSSLLELAHQEHLAHQLENRFATWETLSPFY